MLRTLTTLTMLGRVRCTQYLQCSGGWGAHNVYNALMDEVLGQGHSWLRFFLSKVCCFVFLLMFVCVYGHDWYRSGLPRHMVPSVGSALPAWSCPCMLCWETILSRHKSKLSAASMVSDQAWLPIFHTMHSQWNMHWTGNLCRCTGYRPIMDGFKTFCKDYCCKQGGGEAEEKITKAREHLSRTGLSHISIVLFVSRAPQHCSIQVHLFLWIQPKNSSFLLN